MNAEVKTVEFKNPKRSFLMNAWYVAARPEEVMEKPLGRQICGEKMLN